MIEFAATDGRNLLVLKELDDAAWERIKKSGPNITGAPVYIRKTPDGALEVWPRKLPGYDIVRLEKVEVAE